jgi:exocyst complex protein 7
MDSTKVREEVEDRLRIEEESVAWLTGKIKQSSDLTSTMTNVLNSFEERLTRLEATILPVYQETENLQRRQENIDKTLEALGTIHIYYVSTSLPQNLILVTNLSQIYFFRQNKRI